MVELTELRARLLRRLPEVANAALEQTIAVARDMAIPAYLVGGPVRDLLLDLPVEDLDLVFQGDAIAVAERFVERVGGTITRHVAFGTAKAMLGDEFHIDFVTARAEEYPYPAALPVVRPSTIEDDLLRRDFTLNTLALRLDLPDWQLLDICNGVADLQDGTIRILHDRSFIDDPTRMMRAARFAARLGYRIEPHTRDLILDTVTSGMIEQITPIRMLNEIWLSLEEPAPERVFALLDELGVLAHVLPGVVWSTALAKRLATLPEMEHDREDRKLFGLGLLVHAVPAPARQALLDRYAWSTAEQRIVGDVSRIEQIIERLASETLRLSELDLLLRGLDPIAFLLAEQLAPADVWERLRRGRAAQQSLDPLLTGDDLRRMQIPPGPLYRTLLQGLRAAQLDGEITTRPAAEAWIRAHSA